MSVAQKRDRLIEAMHATNGERHGKTTDWLAWACFYPDLRDALCAVFRGQMPTHQKLGQWFAQHQGHHVGELVLQGQYRSKRKGWIWRSVPKEKLAPPPITRPVAQPIPVPAPAPEPAAYFAPLKDNPPPEQYEFETKISSQGVTTRTMLIDPRTGELVKKKAAVQAPKPTEPERPPTRVEQMRADYLRRNDSARVGVGGSGFSDPGGVVSHNMTTEQRQGRAYCRVAGTWSGG